VSLAAVGQHLHWGRLHARQDQVSQIIGDRWKTWCRLLDALDLPGGIRKPRAIGDNRVPDPTRPFEDPTASLTALLVILFREAWHLHIREGPTGDGDPRALTMAFALAKRFSVKQDIRVFLSLDTEIAQTGHSTGTLPCTIKFDSMGYVNISSLQRVCADNAALLTKSGLNVPTLLSLHPDLRVIDLWKNVGSGKLPKTKACFAN
jgi:hypothetical protein